MEIAIKIVILLIYDILLTESTNLLFNNDHFTAKNGKTKHVVLPRDYSRVIGRGLRREIAIKIVNVI